MQSKVKLSVNLKSIAAVAAMTFAVGLLAVNMTRSTNDTAQSEACECQYNSALPASHPNNRCAQTTDDVSWKNWLVGNSRSSQFHFLDLLELLHGHNNRPIDDVNPTTQQNSF
ncbi:hypothetical protein [Shewanella sp. Isolate11]|uniref:hypothetical protein n=1 Tax=Shewanella sp. Isolate11 TaxID=2908530 RepID=UPI001EFE08E9|nr:hypothetical protein [Shewanella sp. Isolate11]MCG9695359.1 hypothetical protein [Shewanella sp. Isolate11]